ncbi:hypothetical protein N7470_007352 [Penicillium chermesinum]|nr:hypothetical protein N7470_007352 [Penicillium chermesinum]
MDRRPTKRQRRAEAPFQSDSKPVTLSSRPKPTRARPSPAPSIQLPSSSPSPTKTPPRPVKSQSKSLHNFFQPASEGQRWSSQKFEPQRSALAPEVTLDADVIEDDYDSYDEIFTQHIASQKPDNASKSSCNKPPAARSQVKTASRPKPQSSKRFVMASRPNERSRQPSPLNSNDLTDIDSLPWAQRFAPVNLDELAVHKRKVSDVQKWLEEAFSGRRKERLLILRGPAGSGKTTTLSLLSKVLGFDIVEWRNPAVPDYTMHGYTSIGAQFDDFLGRGDRYGGLEFDHAKADETHIGHSGTSQDRRVLLVEEFPTVFHRGSSSLASFRASLQRYLAATTRGTDRDTHPPIVMIVSETLLGSASSISDNLTVHRLLGPALYNHPGTTIIDFNSVASTYMQKALRLVLEKETKMSNHSSVPGQAVLDAICDVGDIRSAISSFGLGMLHAVGKIVYNKRMDKSLMPVNAIIPPSPPDYLSSYDRPKVSEVAVDELIDETGTDVGTFICALHENYPPSCHGPAFTDSLNACIEALSDSDILSPGRRSIHGSRTGIGLGIGATPLNTGVDLLRQDEISFQVAARGLLFGLPYPVNRRVSPSDGKGRAGDVYKMLYPTSLRLWQKRRRSTGVSSWKKLRFGLTVSGVTDDRPHGSVVTMMSRSDALLYQLPYVARIQPQDAASSLLTQITRIRGNLLEDVEEDVVDDGLGPELPRDRRTGVGSHTAFGPIVPPLEEEKLILSDDDIVDD